jgi:outer membrane protein assembly factor BamB
MTRTVCRLSVAALLTLGVTVTVASKPPASPAEYGQEPKRAKTENGAPLGESWPQWRGPTRTGTVPAMRAPSAWPERINKGWSVEVGEGYSSPVAAEGRVYVHGRRDPDEIVYAIDLGSGKIVWQQRYPAAFTKNPYAKDMAKGPYSTPLVSGGRVYTLGTSAILSAWNASTGALVWRKDFSGRVNTSNLFCGTAMSPIATEDGIVVHVGDDKAGVVAAFNPATVKELWTRDMQGPGYASPVQIDVQGTPQLVTLTMRAVVGISARNGELLWEFPFKDEWNENIVTPVASASGIIVSGVRQGTRALTVTRVGTKWSVQESWHAPDVTMYMSSPVLVNGVLYGHSSRRKGQFVALDPATGKVRWATEGRNAPSASVVGAGNYLVFLTSDSELIVARANADRYEETRRYTVGGSATYAHPIVLRDRLIVRDATHVTQWSLQ